MLMPVSFALAAMGARYRLSVSRLFVLVRVRVILIIIRFKSNASAVPARAVPHAIMQLIVLPVSVLQIHAVDPFAIVMVVN
jgi:hypothetical protein